MAFFSLYTEKERAVESLVAGLYVQWNMLPHKMEIQTTVKKIREIDFTKNQVDMPQQQ